MSSQETTDSSLPTDQQSETVSKADFDRLSANYHAANRQIEKLKGSQINPDNLIKDTDFVKRVFEAHNVPFNDEGKFVIPEAYKDEAAREMEYQKRLKDARTTWEAKDFNPLKSQLDDITGRFDSVNSQNLSLRLEMRARDEGVVDSKFKSTNPFGGNEKAVHTPSSRFKYSGDHNDYIMYEGDNPVYTSTGDVITPDNFWGHFKATATDEHKLDWFGNPAQKGSGFQNNGKGRGSYTMSRSDARKNPSKYRALDAEAKKNGQQVTLVD